MVMTCALFVAPCAIEIVGDPAASEKLCAGAAVTVSASGAVCAVTPLPVARTVRLVVAAAALAAAVIVIVLEAADPDKVVGAAAAVMPVGNPSTANATSPVYPPVRVSVTVTVPFDPACTLSVLADSAMLIAGVGWVPPLSSPPLQAASVAPATNAVTSLLISIMPTRTRPPDMMKTPIPRTDQPVRQDERTPM
jgi:hypothetical protein